MGHVDHPVPLPLAVWLWLTSPQPNLPVPAAGGIPQDVLIVSNEVPICRCRGSCSSICIHQIDANPASMAASVRWLPDSTISRPASLRDS
ncbi:hypothetical protein [Streptomyces acidicola]|uniref:hypothetical protein n=1 Tax=Streptomyces acidicola TaxID=2596892 RepID=UPI003809B25D